MEGWNVGRGVRSEGCWIRIVGGEGGRRYDGMALWAGSCAQVGI